MQELIKHPSILRYGYRYEIKRSSSVRYRYAEPMEYANNMCTGDCWIVDIAGNVDPKYAGSPISFSYKELKNGIPCESQSHKSVSLVLEGGDKNGDKSVGKRDERTTKKDRRRRRREQKTS